MSPEQTLETLRQALRTDPAFAAAWAGAASVEAAVGIAGDHGITVAPQDLAAAAAASGAGELSDTELLAASGGTGWTSPMWCWTIDAAYGC